MSFCIPAVFGQDKVKGRVTELNEKQEAIPLLS